MARLRFSARSHVDLDLNEIWDGIAIDSPRNADAVHEHLFLKFEQLLRQPLSGHRRDEVKRGLRSLGSDGFAIFYRYRGGEVHISRIVHQSRNLTALEFDEIP
jgi:plasmid stabilization system protein ParE